MGVPTLRPIRTAQPGVSLRDERGVVLLIALMALVVLTITVAAALKEATTFMRGLRQYKELIHRYNIDSAAKYTRGYTAAAQFPDDLKNAESGSTGNAITEMVNDANFLEGTDVSRFERSNDVTSDIFIYTDYLVPDSRSAIRFLRDKTKTRPCIDNPSKDCKIVKDQVDYCMDIVNLDKVHPDCEDAAKDDIFTETERGYDFNGDGDFSDVVNGLQEREPEKCVYEIRMCFGNAWNRYAVYVEERINYKLDPSVTIGSTAFVIEEGGMYAGEGFYADYSLPANPERGVKLMGLFDVGKRADPFCPLGAKNCVEHRLNPRVEPGDEPYYPCPPNSGCEVMVDKWHYESWVPPPPLPAPPGRHLDPLDALKPWRKPVPFPQPCKFTDYGNSNEFGSIDEDRNGDGDMLDPGERKECLKPFVDKMNCIDNVRDKMTGTARFDDGGINRKLNCDFDVEMVDETTAGNGDAWTLWKTGGGLTYVDSDGIKGNLSMGSKLVSGQWTKCDKPTDLACTNPYKQEVLKAAGGAFNSVCSVNVTIPPLPGICWPMDFVNPSGDPILQNVVIDGDVDFAGKAQTSICPFAYDQNPERCTDGNPDDKPGSPDDPGTCVINDLLCNCKYGQSWTCPNATCITNFWSNPLCVGCSSSCGGVCLPFCWKGDGDNCCYVDTLFDFDRNCDDWGFGNVQCLFLPSAIGSCPVSVECGVNISGTVVIGGNARFGSKFNLMPGAKLYVLGDLTIEDSDVEGIFGTGWFDTRKHTIVLQGTSSTQPSVVYVRGDLYIKVSSIPFLASIINIFSESLYLDIQGGNDTRTLRDDAILLVRGVTPNSTDVQRQSGAHNRFGGHPSSWDPGNTWNTGRMQDVVNDKAGGIASKHVHQGWTDSNDDGSWNVGEAQGDWKCHCPLNSTGTGLVAVSVSECMKRVPLGKHVHYHSVDDPAISTVKGGAALGTTNCSDNDTCGNYAEPYAPWECRQMQQDPTLTLAACSTTDSAATNYYDYAYPVFNGHEDVEIRFAGSPFHPCVFPYNNVYLRGTLFSYGGVAIDGFTDTFFGLIPNYGGFVGHGNVVSRREMIINAIPLDAEVSGGFFSCSTTDDIPNETVYPAPEKDMTAGAPNPIRSFNMVTMGDLIAPIGIGLQKDFCRIGESACSLWCAIFGCSCGIWAEYNNGAIFTNGKLVTGDKEFCTTNVIANNGNVFARRLMLPNDYVDFYFFNVDLTPYIQINDGGWPRYYRKLREIGFGREQMKTMPLPDTFDFNY